MSRILRALPSVLFIPLAVGACASRGSSDAEGGHATESTSTTTTTETGGDGDGDPCTEWERVEGSAEREYAAAVTRGGADAVYVVGRTAGVLDPDTAVGGGDAFVRKHSETGDVLWTRQLGSSSHDVANGVAVDPEGGVIVVGNTEGQIADQPWTGSEGAFVARFEADGTLDWVQQFGDGFSNYANGVAISPGGEVYVVGSTDGQLADVVDNGQPDAYLARYDLAGDITWVAQLQASFGADATAAHVLESGDIVVTGSVAGALAGNEEIGGPDLFVARFDDTGGLVWAHQLGSAEEDYARSVVQSPAGDVYIVGETYEGILLDPPTSSDAFVASMGTDGNVQWIERYGTGSDEGAWAAALDATGTLLIAGTTSGLFDGGDGMGSGFVMSIHPDSTAGWARQFGTVGTSTVLGFAPDDARGAFVVGYRRLDDGQPAPDADHELWLAHVCAP